MHKIINGAVFALIPARFGSKGVIDKNIKPLGGHPLLAYSVAAARSTRIISRVIVSTDSAAYAAVASTYGAEVPFLRPTEFAGDYSTDGEVLRHFLDWLQENEGGVPEYVVHLRPTTPFRDPVLLDEALRVVMARPDATALRSAHEMSETAYKCLEIRDGRFKPVGSDSFDMDKANLPRQHFPLTYSANGYVDILLPRCFFSSGAIHGDRVVPFLTPRALEVDVPDDFATLEAELATAPAVLLKALSAAREGTQRSGANFTK